MQNHYAPPQSQVTDVYQNTGVVDNNVIESLRRTRFWTQISAITSFITAGIALSTIAAILLGNKLLGGASSAEMIGAMMMNLASLGFNCLFGLLLFRYSANIARLLQSGSMQDLAMAMRAQRLFWKFLGVFIIVIMGLMVVLFIGGIFFAIATGADATL